MAAGYRQPRKPTPNHQEVVKWLYCMWFRTICEFYNSGQHAQLLIKKHAQLINVHCECAPMTWGKDTFRSVTEPVRRNKVPWYHTTAWTGQMGAPTPRQIKKVVPWKQTRSGQPLRSKCRVQLKSDGTRWRREGTWRGNRRMEWVASTLPLCLGTWSIHHYYQQFKHTTSCLAAW
jgi:hypothetical protein